MLLKYAFYHVIYMNLSFTLKINMFYDCFFIFLINCVNLIFKVIAFVLFITFSVFTKYYYSELLTPVKTLNGRYSDALHHRLLMAGKA